SCHWTLGAPRPFSWQGRLSVPLRVCRDFRTPAACRLLACALRPPVYLALNTFITSSPRWLMTFTAMRPDAGLSNGRDVSLLSVAQASALISAFSVVLSALYGSLAPRK